MPRFTITTNGQTVRQIDAFGDRIDLGSGSDCAVLIDGPAVAAREASLVRDSHAQNYRLEPASFELVGIEVSDGTVFSIGNHQVRVDYLAGEMEPLALPPYNSPESPVGSPNIDSEAERNPEPTAGELIAEDAPVVSTNLTNLFVPLVDPPRGRRIPSWGWILAGVGVALIVGILLLIAF
jgi:hypothetical protein